MKKPLNFGQRMKLLKQERKVKALKDIEVPKEKGDIYSNIPLSKKRIEATEPTYSSKMEENTSTSAALEKALNSLRDKAQGL